MEGTLKLPLPPLIECDVVPDDRTEVAHYHPHLQPVASKIPPVDRDAPILLLSGRDLIRVHKVREQINGLGHCGGCVLGHVHKPSDVNVYKANVLINDHASFLRPCPNSIHVKEDYDGRTQHHSTTFPACEVNTSLHGRTDNLGSSVFGRSKDDNKLALSLEDKAFLAIMDAEVYQNEENSWVTPLPFCAPRRRLPNNREQALKRLCSLRGTLEKKPESSSYSRCGTNVLLLCHPRRGQGLSQVPLV